MQGVILSAGTAQGIVLGDDGERYTFTPLGWRDSSVSPQAGMRVDFEVRGSHAVGIYPIEGAAPSPPPAQPTPVPPTMQGAPTGQPPSQVLPPTQPAGAPPPLPPTQPAGAPPPVSPTAQSAPPAQTPPPPPSTSGGSRMKGWYWAIAGGATLIIVGIVGAFVLGVFPTSTPPVGVEVAHLTHGGKTYVLVEYGDELAIFSESGEAVGQRELAEEILHSHALSQAVGDFDVADLTEVSEKVRRLSDSVSKAKSLSNDMVGILEELGYMEAGDGVSVRGVVREAFADRARNTSGMDEAESLIRSLNSDLNALADNAATLTKVTEGTRGVDLPSASGDEMGALFAEAASAALELQNSLSSAKGNVSKVKGAADDMERALLKASAMRPIRDSDSLRDTLRDFTGRAKEFESELSNLSNTLGEFESGLGPLGDDARSALDSADSALGDYMARWIAEPYDTVWPPTDPERRSASVALESALAPAPVSAPAAVSPAPTASVPGRQTPFMLEWETSATEIGEGESFTLTVRMYEVQEAGEHGGITVSFPSLTQAGGSKERYSSSVANVEAVDYTSGLSKVTFHQPGVNIYHKENNRQFPAEYLLVESDDASWSRSDDRTLVLQITPKRGGEFSIQIRGWLCKDGYSDCSRNPVEGAETDQQGWGVERVTVVVDMPSASVTVGSESTATPTPAAPKADSIYISAGGDDGFGHPDRIGFTCALRQNGEAVCWGHDSHGQSSPPPGHFTAISSGGYHACGLRESGQAVCWGNDSRGQSSPPAGRFTAISSGHDHTCGLRESGEAVCWGGNSWGQSSPSAGRFTAISSASWYACGLRENGEAVCWGGHSHGYGGETPPDGRRFTTISAGYDHTCGLHESGQAVCWGADIDGQATQPPGRFTAISAGRRHTCGLRENGEAVCWGSNEQGRATPADGRFLEISAGKNHACGLRENGEVVCWGNNEDGQADVPATLRRTPTPTVAPTAVQTPTVAPTPTPAPASGRIAFASDRDGNWEIYVVNADGSGLTRLTDNTVDDQAPSWSPDGRRIAFQSNRSGGYDIYVMNSDGSGVTRLTDDSEYDFTPSWSLDGRRIAFTSTRDGNWEIYAMNVDGSDVTRLTDNETLDWRPIWSPDGRRIAFYSDRDGDYEIYIMNADGSNVSQLTHNEVVDGGPSWSPAGQSAAALPAPAVPATVGNQFESEQLDASVGYSSVAADLGEHTCALKLDGQVECWGNSEYGQTDVPAGNFTRICNGYNHTCALHSDGEAVCWGRNNYGQASPPDGNFTDISAGADCTCGLDTNGAVVCWGRCDREASYDFGSPPDGRFVKISLGAGHACVLSGSGEAECWGDDRKGGATPPSGRFVEISAGSDHSCGLRPSGEAECWGRDWDGYGAEDVPSNVLFKSISAGWSHTCALRTDGEAVCWGRDNLGQSSPPPGTYTSISAGSDYSCAVREDGEVVCWGRNDDGQATPPQ